MSAPILEVTDLVVRFGSGKSQTTVIAGVSFDLHEGDQPSPADHQVDVVVPQPESVRFDAPPAADQKRHGHALTPESAAVAGIGPLGHGNRQARARHATMLADRAEGGEIISAAAGATNCR